MASRGSLLGRKSSLTILFALLAGLSLLFFGGETASGAGVVPNGFSQGRLAGGLVSPTAMAFAPDGRLFVTEQRGTIRVVKDGRLLARPFVNLSSSVDDRGERGLLGVAFDPGFGRSNRYVYVYYTQRATSREPAHNRVARITASGDGAVPGSVRTIFRLNNLSEAQNHNGGAVHFGPDGKLYVAVGENARAAEAQSLDNLLGKMLRINSNGSVPGDNPYYGRTRGKNKAIWALGLRNPYSFAFRPGSSRMFINDVGAQTWEEINVGRAGANYGWPIKEGPEREPRFVSPLFAYRHDGPVATTGCAITGGAFYAPRTARFPAAYRGDYFFADFCSGWIRKRDAANGRVSGFATGFANPVDLRVGPDGGLYVLERGEGAITRIGYRG